MQVTSSDLLTILQRGNYKIHYRMCLSQQENGAWLLYSLLLDAIPLDQVKYYRIYPYYYQAASFTYTYPSIIFTAGQMKAATAIAWFDHTVEHYLYPNQEGSLRSLSVTFFTNEKQDGTNMQPKYFSLKPYPGFSPMHWPHKIYELYRKQTIQTIYKYDPLTGSGPDFPNFAIAHAELMYGQKDWDIAQRMSSDPRIHIRIASNQPFFHEVQQISPFSIQAMILGEVDGVDPCKLGLTVSGGARNEQIITNPGKHAIGLEDEIPSQWHLMLTKNGELIDEYRFDSRYSDPLRRNDTLRLTGIPIAQVKVQNDSSSSSLFINQQEKTQEDANSNLSEKTSLHKFKEVKLIRIIIVSPSDVVAERKKAYQVVDELNRTIAKEKGVVLELWSWENDTYPGLHLKGAQGQVDEIMNIEDSDIIIGIFWQRFGTPVEDAQSGTEHELRRAFVSWRNNKSPQIMLYFKTRAIHPGKVDIQQLQKIQNFKKEFSSYGLIGDFGNSNDFINKLRGHLTQYLMQHF